MFRRRVTINKRNVTYFLKGYVRNHWEEYKKPWDYSEIIINHNKVL